MQKNIEVKHGDSMENAIINNAQNAIPGVIEEHKHIDRICGTKDNGVIVDHNRICMIIILSL